MRSDLIAVVVDEKLREKLDFEFEKNGGADWSGGGSAAMRFIDA
jgi:hypothetical protein